MLGHAAIDVLGGEFDVVASVRDLDVAREHRISAQLVTFDARTDDISRLLDEVDPDAVLNAIGLIKQLAGGQDPAAAIRLNALFPHELANACTPRGVRVIHVSTDCVFSGALPAPGRYNEDHLPDARDVYGRSKLLGELAGPNTLTLRTSIIGRELERASGLMEWFAACSGEQVGGFTGAVFSGLTTRELSRLVGHVVREHPELCGLWHVAAAPIDKHALLLKLRDVLGVDCEIVPRDDPVINRALNGTRFERIVGYGAPSWDEMLAEYVTRTDG